jgi:hypothetical protein
VVLSAGILFRRAAERYDQTISVGSPGDLPDSFRTCNAVQALEAAACAAARIARAEIETGKWKVEKGKRYLGHPRQSILVGARAGFLGLWLTGFSRFVVSLYLYF